MSTTKITNFEPKPQFLYEFGVTRGITYFNAFGAPRKWAHQLSKPLWDSPYNIPLKSHGNSPSSGLILLRHLYWNTFNVTNWTSLIPARATSTTALGYLWFIWCHLFSLNDHFIMTEGKPKQTTNNWFSLISPLLSIPKSLWIGYVSH